MKVLREHFVELIPHILDYNYTVPENKKLEVNNRIFQHYLREKLLSMMAAQEITHVSISQTKLFFAYFICGLINNITSTSDFTASNGSD
jgi:hypothetical protein